jgi:hypothetical protein
MKTLKFTKMMGKTDRVEFYLAGVKVVALQNPKQGIIPHDMVHYIIEKCFPFEGFVQLVFSGHEPGKVMEVLGGFAPKLPSEYSQTSWITESLVESLQASLWSGSTSFEDFQYGYQKACEARRIQPQTIQIDQFQHCMALIADLTQRWQRLSENETLELEV